MDNIKDAFSSLSEDQQLLLSCYVDGELKGAKVRFVEARLKEDAIWQAAFSELKQLSAGVNAWCQSQVTAYDRSIWPNLLVQLENEKQSFIERLLGSLRIPAAGPGLAIMATVFVGVLYYSLPNANELPASPQNEMLRVATAVPETVHQIEIAPLQIPLETQEAYRQVLASSRVPDISTSAFANRDFVRGGLRTNGVDIHWVKSSSPVQIHSSAGQQSSPVLWVSKTSSGIKDFTSEFSPHDFD